MDVTDLETGTGAKVEMQCSEGTKSQLKQAMAGVDPNMTYEEFLIAALRVYDEYPSRFERNHY